MAGIFLMRLGKGWVMGWVFDLWGELSYGSIGCCLEMEKVESIVFLGWPCHF